MPSISHFDQLFYERMRRLCEVSRSIACCEVKLKSKHWMCMEAWFSQIRSHIDIIVVYVYGTEKDKSLKKNAGKTKVQL